MKKLFIALMCAAGVVSCSFGGGNNSENGGDNGSAGNIKADTTIDQLNEAGYSMKFTYFGDGSHTGTFIFTHKYYKKEDGTRLNAYRWDTIENDDHTAYIYFRNNETACTYYDEEWEDTDYYRTQQTVNNLNGDWIADSHELLSGYGFSKTGTEKILGIPCDVWSGTYEKGDHAWGVSTYGQMTAKDGNTGEFAVWNGLTLRTKVNGKVQSECTAFVMGVPDTAFYKTLDITWIK